MNTIRQLISYLAFPLILGGGVSLTWWGLAHKWPPGLAVLGSVLLAMVALALLERVHPYTERWSESRGDVGTDVAHLLINQLVLPKLLKAVLLAILVQVAVVLREQLGHSLWPSEAPVLIQLFLSLAITDFIRYWLHRGSHSIGWLWRFHAIHHSSERLYWLNAARFHPVDKLLHTVVLTVPPALLGVGDTVLSLQFVLSGIHGLFQHANIDVRLGPLNYVFAMAELHRWHHSRKLDEANANYGNNLILWDIVFGTRYDPRERRAGADVGLADRSLPESFLAHMRAPFARQRAPFARRCAPREKSSSQQGECGTDVPGLPSLAVDDVVGGVSAAASRRSSG